MLEFLSHFLSTLLNFRRWIPSPRLEMTSADKRDPPLHAAAYVLQGEGRKFCRRFLDGADNQQKSVWLVSCFFLWIQRSLLGITEAAQREERNREERVHQASAS